MTGRLRAFSLLEMLLVLGLLAVLMFITLPALQNLLQGQLTREVNRLTSVIRVLRNEAILTRNTFRLVFDFQANAYSVEQATPSGEFGQRRDPSILAPHRLPTDFKLQDVMLFGDLEHPLSEKPVPVVLDASGFMDPFLLHFVAGGAPYTIRVSGFTAELHLLPGYVRQ